MPIFDPGSRRHPAAAALAFEKRLSRTFQSLRVLAGG